MTLEDLRPPLTRLMGTPQRSEEALGLLKTFRGYLNSGEICAAKKGDSGWEADPWVKAGILLHSMLGELENCGDFRNWELDTLPLRRFKAADLVRAPEGCRVRDGSYWGPGSICMPPSFVSLGASIGEGTTIDSNASVGLCAQLGSNVMVSAGAQIGGVLVPLERLPVIIEDGVFFSPHTAVFGSVVVGEHSVIAGGVTLSDTFPVWDFRSKQPLPQGPHGVLMIPPRSIILNAGLPTTAGIVVQSPILAAIREADEPPAAAIRRALLSL